MAGFWGKDEKSAVCKPVSRRNSAQAYQEIHSRMFIVAVFVLTKTEIHPMTTEKKIKKL